MPTTNAPAETSPLLTPAVENPPSPSQDGSSSLPRAQLALLCFARMTEPIAFFSIFPFIAAMVSRNGRLPASDVGFYSGVIESVFSAAQTLVLFIWVRIADLYGRKPALVVSMGGLAVTSALFGVSSSLGGMVALRCLAGVMAGSPLIVRTVVAEVCGREQAAAYGWLAVAGNVGILLGPVVGGALADPVVQYPGVFSGGGFLERYPYALSGWAVGIVGVVAAGGLLVFMRESVGVKGSTTAAEDMTMRQLVMAPGVAAALWTYTHVMFLAFAYTAVLPVVLFTPVELGGLGLSPLQISAYMAVQGASQALWLLLVFPALQRRVGTRGVLRLCAAVYPFFFGGYVVMNLLLRTGSRAATVWFCIVAPLVAVVGPGVSMAFTAVQLALNDVSPDPRLLGTLNALALTCTGAIRAVVPAVATVVYAVGVRQQIAGGHLAWLVLIPMTLALFMCLRFLRDQQPQ